MGGTRGDGYLAALQAYVHEIIWVVVWAILLGLSIAAYAAIAWLQWVSARTGGTPRPAARNGPDANTGSKPRGAESAVLVLPPIPGGPVQRLESPRRRTRRQPAPD